MVSVSVSDGAYTVYKVHQQKPDAYKNVHPTKLIIGKWSSLLILQQQLSLDQKKVKNGNILK